MYEIVSDDDHEHCWCSPCVDGEARTWGRQAAGDAIRSMIGERRRNAGQVADEKISTDEDLIYCLRAPGRDKSRQGGAADALVAKP